MHAVRTILLLLFSALVAGCHTGAPEPEGEVAALLREQVRSHEEYSAILQSVQDEATMKAALPKLAELAQSSAANARRLRKWRATSQEAVGDLTEWQGRLQKAIQSRLRERERIRGLPGGEEFLQRLDSLGQLHQALSE